jgi:hypothetical protein
MVHSVHFSHIKHITSIPWKFWNLLLEKDDEDQLDRSCEKCRSIANSEGGRKILHKIKITKVNWIRHLLRRNCLLKHIIEGQLEVMGRRRRRLKQLLDCFKETRGYWKLKEEALARTVWRTRFGRGYWPWWWWWWWWWWWALLVK